MQQGHTNIFKHHGINPLDMQSELEDLQHLQEALGNNVDTIEVSLQDPNGYRRKITISLADNVSQDILEELRPPSFRPLN